MRIPDRIDYAVRALLVVASSDALCNRREIAERAGVPAAYLGSLMVQLRASDLVTSVRGRQGGYRLSRAASEITLADVLGALDDIDVDHDPSSPLARTWDHLHGALLSAASDITIADLGQTRLDRSGFR